MFFISCSKSKAGNLYLFLGTCALVACLYLTKSTGNPHTLFVQHCINFWNIGSRFGIKVRFVRFAVNQVDIVEFKSRNLLVGR